MLPDSNPAADPQVIELSAQSDKFVTLAQTYAVATPEQYTDAGAQLKSIKDAQKRLDDLRKGMTRPLDAAKKAIMDLFRGPEDKLARAESGIKRAMIAFNDEQARIQREQQRIADENARKERERLAAQAARAEASGKVEKAEQLQERAAQVVAPVVQRETPKVAGINMRDVWKFEISDPNAVPREYLMVDETKIRKVVGALKGDTVIPGVRVYAEKQMAAGAA